MAQPKWITLHLATLKLSYHTSHHLARLSITQLEAVATSSANVEIDHIRLVLSVNRNI